MMALTIVIPEAYTVARDMGKGPVESGWLIGSAAAGTAVVTESARALAGTAQVLSRQVIATQTSGHPLFWLYSR